MPSQRPARTVTLPTSPRHRAQNVDQSPTVDTSNANDPRADVGELSGITGPVACVVTGLHTK